MLTEKEAKKLPVAARPREWQRELNFVIGEHVTDRDIEIFFGPLQKDNPEDIVQRLPDTTKWQHIMKEAGVFGSASDAARNGWNKDVQEGFHDIIAGKKPRKRVTVLKVTRPPEVDDGGSAAEQPAG